MKYMLSLATMLAICSFSFSQRTDDEIKKIMENSKNVVLNLNSSVINKDGAFLVPTPKNEKEDLTWKTTKNCKCETCKCNGCKCTGGVCKCCDSGSCTNCTTGACAVPIQAKTFKKLVIISAPSWCSPCQMLESQTLSNEQVKASIPIEKHDGDKDPDILVTFNIKKYPTIICLENNKEIWRVEEFITPEMLLSLIKNNKITLGDYRWVPIEKPIGGILSNWMAGDHSLYCGDKFAGYLRGNGWFFSAPDSLMAEPSIPRPNGIRKPVEGEVCPELNGYGTRWKLGGKLNSPPLPGQPGYENFGYQMTSNLSAPVANNTSLEAAQRAVGVPVGAAPSYNVGVFDARTGVTSQVPVYHIKGDGSVDYNVQPCNRPLRPNPTEYNVPLGNSSLSSHSSVSMDHTHTCPRCKYTWNHAEDGGSHRCPKCGTFQNVQDTGRQPITVNTPTISAPMIMSSGSCSSGSCSSGNKTYSGNYFSGNKVFSGARVFSSGNCSSGNCNR